MAGQKGRDVLIKIGDGGAPETFTTLAGIRAKTIALNARSVDATSGDSNGAWRELIAGAGVRSARISGSGVFKDSVADGVVRDVFFAQAARSFQLIVPDFGALEGAFVIESLEYAGDHDGEATYRLTLESAGVISFTAL